MSQKFFNPYLSARSADKTKKEEKAQPITSRHPDILSKPINSEKPGWHSSINLRKEIAGATKNLVGSSLNKSPEKTQKKPKLIGAFGGLFSKILSKKKETTDFDKERSDFMKIPSETHLPFRDLQSDGESSRLISNSCQNWSWFYRQIHFRIPDEENWNKHPRK